MSEWEPIRVTNHMGDPEVDALGVFEALTKGDDWNGWITPYFTEQQGKRIAAWTRALKERFPAGEVETVEWDEARKAFVLEDPQYPHVAGEPLADDDLVEGMRCEELGLTLYGIGAYKWTWERAIR